MILENKGIFVSQNSYGYTDLGGSVTSKFYRSFKWIQKLLQITYKSLRECPVYTKSI